MVITGNTNNAMKTNDLLTITTAAVATAALTVATFGGSPLEAGGDAATPALKIAIPMLVSHGVTMTLTAPGGRVWKAGEQPAFELKAVNGAGQAATVCVSVTMNSTSLASMMSRVPRAPAVLWQEQCTLTLKAGETQVFTLAAHTNLPPNCMISVLLGEVDPTLAKKGVTTSFASFGPGAALPLISALNFSTLTNPPGAPAGAPFRL